MTGSICRHGRLVSTRRGWRSVDASLTGLTRIPAGPETGGAPSERTVTDEADDLDRVGHRGSRDVDGRGPESREDRPRTLSRLLRSRGAATLRAGGRAAPLVLVPRVGEGLRGDRPGRS